MRILKYQLADFARYTKKAMREWHVPGMAVAVVKHDKVIYARGFGVKKLGSSEQVNENTVFQIGSIAKSFTAALVSMMINERKLSWHEKVKDHLRNFQLHDFQTTQKFMIEDLMAQRSGLPPHSGRLLPYLGFNRDYIIKTLKYIKPTGTFRRDYAYQNNLFLVAAALIEKITGKSWEENLTARIINPLAMSSTTASLKCYLGSGNAAQGYFYNGPGPDSPVTCIPRNWPHNYWLYTIAPAGGINSSVLDLSKWLSLHLGKGGYKRKQLISIKDIRFIHTPKISAGPDVWGGLRYYCEGWVYSKYSPYPILWHNGGTSGMKSIVAMVPQAGVGIVVLCNLYESLLPEALSRYFFDLWFNNPKQDWSLKLLKMQKEQAACLQKPDAPYTLPRPLNCYTGIYYNNLYGVLSVTKNANSLILTLGPQKIRLKLKHWGGDTFVLYWPGVITNGAGVQFYSGRYGKVETIEIQGMNDDLTGVFTKCR